MSAVSQPQGLLPANETEERLLDAALTLFAEKGYEATSVREVIDAIGMTRPVLYYYARSKEDLFQRVVRWKHDEAYRQLGASIEQTSGCENGLRAILRQSFAFAAADPRLARLMFQTHFGPRIPGVSEFMGQVAGLRFAIVYQVIESGLSRGEIQGGDAASLALVFCCVMDQHINVLSRLPDPENRLTGELADGLVDVFLHGIGTCDRKSVCLPATTLRT